MELRKSSICHFCKSENGKFSVSKHIEPLAPLRGGANVDINQNWDIDCPQDRTGENVKNGHNNVTSGMDGREATTKRQRRD